MDDQARLAEFEARIARGEKIEPGDWMPSEYRRQLLRMMSQHAHSEIVGMLPEGEWITRAPSLKRKLVLLAKVQDEGGHGQYLYDAAESLGATRDEMIEALHSGRAKYANVFNYPAPTWADVGMIGWLVDEAAILNQSMLAKCSYGPYARAMLRICSEETFHKKQGQELVIRLARGTPAQRAMAQEALNRWWWPTLMQFGYPDAESPHTDTLRRWGIKTKTNDELRETFIAGIVPSCGSWGSSLPIPSCAATRRPAAGITARSISTNSNEWSTATDRAIKRRLGERIKAHEEGAWVREALLAYNIKHEQARHEPTQRELSGAPA